MDDPKQVVRRGYDVLSRRYDDATGADSKYQPWIDELIARLGPNSRVLDVGCGSGIPVARALTAARHHVVGVDISEVQITRARELVPQAEFINADAMSLDFTAESFDAVVSLYALIHLPLGRAAGAPRPDRYVAPTRGMLPLYDGPHRLDRHRGQLAGRWRPDVVEPHRHADVPHLAG